MKNNPDNSETVAVIIPVFNREHTIRRAIDSALNQTYPNVEVMIIDDCSTDDSWGIIQEYARSDSRVRASRNEQNLGSNTSRNRAMEMSNAKWFAFLDSDDEWHVDHLEKLFQRIDFFRNTAGMFDPEIAYAKLKVHHLNGSSRYFVAEKFGDIRRDLALGSFIRTSCMMMHRDVIERIGNFYPVNMCGDEYDLLIRATQAGFRVANSPDHTVDVHIQKVRVHVQGKYFPRLFKHHKKFFKRWMTPRELGERLDWATNFVRERGERIHPMIWYFRAWWYCGDFKMLLRSVTAPIYPEIIKLRRITKSNKSGILS